MAPRPRRTWPDGLNQVRDAAGLVLLFPRAGRAHIVLTVRAETLGRHGGQVSLPGGVIEPGEAFEQAALREAHEEIGIDPAHVRVLGELTPVHVLVSESGASSTPYCAPWCREWESNPHGVATAGF